MSPMTSVKSRACRTAMPGSSRRPALGTPSNKRNVLSRHQIVCRSPWPRFPLRVGNKIWNEHIATLVEAEANAWIEATAAVDPSDPPPEDDSWGQPLAFKLPPVEPFPLESTRPSLAHLIRHGARSIGCPLDFLAVAVLPVAGTAIGRSASLLLKERYFASAAIFAACVGLPATARAQPSA